MQLAGGSLQLAELERVNQNLHSLLEYSPHAIFALNLQKHVTYWNPASERVFGWTKEEVLGRPLPIVPEDKTSEFHSLFENVVQGNTITNYETVRQTKDGKRLDICLSTAPYLNQDQMDGFIVIIRDITDFKINQKHLFDTVKELCDVKYALDAATLVTVCDADGSITDVNENFCKTTKFTRAELIGQNHRLINSSYHNKEFFLELWNTIRSGGIWKGEVRNRAKDGEIFWADTIIIPFLNTDGIHLQFMTIRTDVTERKNIEEEIKKREEALRASEARFRSLIQHSYDIIGILDEDGTILYQSPTVEKVTGMRAEELIGRNGYTLLHSEDVEGVKRAINEIIGFSNKSCKYQFRMSHVNGSLLYCEAIATNLLTDPSVNGIVVNYWDITESKQVEEQIQYAANHDYLTGIPNRRLLEETLKKQIQQAKEHSSLLVFMFLDLDGFKYINDTLGHDQGDLLLKEVAHRLTCHVHDKGFVARLGGDEFAIVLPEIDSFESIGVQAELFLQLFEEPFIITSYEFQISASIGVAVYPYGADTSKQLLKNADLAMYQAKADGRNQFKIYTPSMDVGTYKMFSLQNDMKKALHKKQFQLEYQPKVDKNGHLMGAEALIRWHHPKWGTVSPKEFIGLAEKSGNIIPIGYWVLEQVCQQLLEWKREGLPPLKVALNLSPFQFMQTDFMYNVKRILDIHQTDPQNLEFEITETAVFKKEQEAIEKINQLHEIGIDIAIDDFGTGYSSLLYLKKFKVNTVKIDKSFIKDLESDQDSFEIISSIIQLAKKLNLKTVAEGIETEKQLFLLQEMECDELQGYLYSKPVPPDEFKLFLWKGKCDIQRSSGSLPFENKRQFYRIDLLFPLEADMTIIEIGGKKVDIGTTNVLLDDIGPGGVRFSSNIRLPIKPDFILKFRTTILDTIITEVGTLAWGKDLGEGLYQYGLQFEIDEVELSYITSLLNQFQVRLKNKSILPNCRFVTLNRNAYFK